MTLDIDGPVKCPADNAIMSRIEESSYAIFSYEYDTKANRYEQIDLDTGETTIHFECPECDRAYSIDELEAVEE